VSHYDVVIVGYGPVGQVAANMLGQRGSRVAVFETATSVYNLPRAAHFDGEVMRILQVGRAGGGSDAGVHAGERHCIPRCRRRAALWVGGALITQLPFHSMKVRKRAFIACSPRDAPLVYCC
jgi:2-polyprenyl-6-methoxyphenol hydroxylase-like FAD-dependent oxidoreductase